MSVELEEFIEKIKNHELHKNFDVNFIKASVHAFLEELVTEFDSKNQNTYFTFKDEELENFVAEFEKIQNLRKYWKDLKLIK